MAKEKIQEQESAEAKVGQGISSIEKFFNENGKAVWTCLAVVLVVVVAGVLYNRFYLQPKKAEAKEQMFPAEASFRAQQYEIALRGDGNTLGFEQVIDEYGAKAGQSVYLYAGECALQLGEFEEAIGYLKKYNGKDAILAAKALSCEGDALVGLEKYSEALACYEKAAAKIDDMYAATYLKKAAIVCEELGDDAKALSLYKTIKDKYPQSLEGYDVDKYISRIVNAE